ncbi:hypothetical protein BpHYR1_005334 [Brachionus plicatilis]|uniref:Uncharacterized protein n=1 Tax=Brachionus plicatilis TaxID=10195 RepID=A0A3M7R9V6_BRAPC|nr:hypothetical protein BpHYR1_005334 [Brachionus plicatilis]
MRFECECECITQKLCQILKETKGTAENLSVCKLIVSATNRGVDHYIKLLNSLMQKTGFISILLFIY